MVAGESIIILLIEDDPTWIMLAREMLARTGGSPPEVVTAASLAHGMETLRDSRFDLVLLDLSLPDSQDLATLKNLQPHCPATPIVVLTDAAAEDVALACLRAGADDYLPKSEAQPAILWRVIRYAIERHRLRQLLDESLRDVEVRRVEQLANTARTPETARVFAAAPLSEAHPAEFVRFTSIYRQLLEEALLARLYQSSPLEPARVPDLAMEIGRLCGGPRDVLDVHMSVIKQALREVPRPRGQALVEEGRIVVLNLMGHLAAFYRNYYHPSGPKQEV